ncbi:MAG: ATP-binding protein [Pirellulales bacterium]
MHDFEKLGMFYLGRQYDLAQRKRTADLLLYDAKDLTTHAVCVGMTGSGKTGLCLALLEEAAIDGVPAIAIDPKGDLGNLLLTFPQLLPEDFRPWVDEAEAARLGISSDELAARTAESWRKGLADWDQTPERIAKLRASVEMAIYTPGSSAGMPISVLRSFAAPPEVVLDDREALGDRIAASVAGLLALVGVDADPIRSREHILLSQILESAWRKGQDVDVASLIHSIQRPPMDRVGVVDIETFFPNKDRLELAMRLNNLLASPGFAGWMQGEPLDVARLLYTPEGKPRLSIVSIAHLSESERMFFVTILLGEVLSWIRTQPGTSSLRAVLYMDEIFGFFPPTANPPSKQPMLTLLKQARAYGLGIVLATQNPVDIDYKGLSNAGTWFLGRLQTERDKARVLEGLEGASQAAGANFDRARMDAALAGLGKRVFLMNNVHENQPVVMETRWCLSYLRGPLTRPQIQTLMAPYKAQHQAAAATPPGAEAAPAAPQDREAPATSATRNAASAEGRPLVPPEARERFMPLRPQSPAESRSPAESPSSTASQPPAAHSVAYRATLVGAARLHYVDAKAKVDWWQELALIARIDDQTADDPWANSTEQVEGYDEFTPQPVTGATFLPVPSAALQPKNYARWEKTLATHLYSDQRLTLWHAPELKEFSQPNQSDAEFRIRIRQRQRELRDEAVAALRQTFAKKHDALEVKIRRARERVDRERSQFQGEATQTVVSIGSSILRALLGRKIASQANVGGAASAARRASQTASQRGDIARAQAALEALQQQQRNLDREFEFELSKLERAASDVATVEYPIRPRKADIAVDWVSLVWVPVS